MIESIFDHLPAACHVSGSASWLHHFTTGKRHVQNMVNIVPQSLSLSLDLTQERLLLLFGAFIKAEGAAFFSQERRAFQLDSPL
ncbi:hypothetical protein [Pusillibacter faecalis]|uniref:hypothetical protein n=1 Tax=Pusillibacter faecalis TaxID=2714358 RepID=UPI001BCC78BD|nr:hypothetical protein [Pusillibacter faecalis]MBS5657993.1 hypothetical protein [Oscillibacter sp.]